MARRRFQEGYVFKRGKKRKVWVARWREVLIGDDGNLTFIRKAEVLGSVSELTKSDAKQKLAEKLDGKQKSGKVDTTGTLGNFVKQWWKPSILPTYKPSTRKQAQLALDNYLVPKFGEYRLSDISNVDVQVLKRYIYPACDRLRIPRVSWHMFRHLHGTLLSQLGVPVAVVQAQLGHADPRITLQIYTHVLPDAQPDAVSRLERFLSDSNGPKLHQNRVIEEIEIDGKLLMGLEKEQWARPGSNR